MVEILRVIKGAKGVNPGETQFPAGYLQGAGGMYRVDQRYIDADREAYVMPVNPDYETIRNVTLLSDPLALIYNAAAANPRNTGLPSLTELTNEGYFRDNIMRKAFGARGTWNSGSDTHNLSPVEITPLVNNSPFPEIAVQYTFGAQRVQEKRNGVEVNGTYPPRHFRSHTLNPYSFAESEDFEGLAYVAHLRVPIDLNRHFDSPYDLQFFNGKIPFSSECRVTRQVREIFHTFFQPNLEQIGEQVSEIRGEAVTGVLLSPITPHYTIEDKGGIKSLNPHGELVMAASYLV